jgi:hypothetical protein
MANSGLAYAAPQPQSSDAEIQRVINAQAVDLPGGDVPIPLPRPALQ